MPRSVSSMLPAGLCIRPSRSTAGMSLCLRLQTLCSNKPPLICKHAAMQPLNHG